MYKLGHLVGGEWAQYRHPALFSLPDAESHQRISAGVPGSDPDLILRLARCLEEPLLLLHILHTTRGEAEPARFQSPELSFLEIEAFISAFRPFLTNDSRFDLWVHSPSQQATLAWDRHDMLYAYGPLDDYEGALRALGFSEGEPQVPLPHAHNYHAELDAMSREVIEWCDWWTSPLRPEDEQ